MLSYLTDHWRATRIIAFALSGMAVTTVMIFTRSSWKSNFQPGFMMVGSLVLFVFAYIWPFLLNKFESINSRLVPRVGKANHSGIKFFFWTALIALPLGAIDNLVPTLKSDFVFGVAGFTGLIAGCCHTLARQRQKDEQAEDGKSVEVV